MIKRFKTSVFTDFNFPTISFNLLSIFVLTEFIFFSDINKLQSCRH